MSSRPAPVLGRLEEVELRSVWTSEPYDFTPWLADGVNLQFLADSLGLPGLELVRTEHPVDSFSADIVCLIVGTNDHVLIENQLEKTDHIHLGQLLTYAAKFDARAVVWVAKNFTGAHRAALDWLNKTTSSDYGFFGVEVRAVKIGDSAPAPLFDVVARPNEWTKPQGISNSSEGAITDLNEQNITFWSALDEALEKSGKAKRRIKKSVKGSNIWIPLSNDSAVYIVVYRATTQGLQFGVYLGIYGPDRDAYWTALNGQKAVIDAAFGTPLRWEANRSGSVLYVSSDRLDAKDVGDTVEQIDWIVQRINKYAEILGPVVAEVRARLA